MVEEDEIEKNFMFGRWKSGVEIMELFLNFKFQKKKKGGVELNFKIGNETWDMLS